MKRLILAALVAVPGTAVAIPQTLDQAFNECVDQLERSTDVLRQCIDRNEEWEAGYTELRDWSTGYVTGCEIRKQQDAIRIKRLQSKLRSVRRKARRR